MKGAEIRAARNHLRLTHDSLAAELGLTPAIIAAWEDGRISVPSRYARDLTWRVAVAERNAALAMSGLPECTWEKEWTDAPLPENSEQRLKHLNAYVTHHESCPTCRARETYVDERFPPMPPPALPGWLTAFDWIVDRVQRLPNWLQPVICGALLFLAMTGVRTLLMLLYPLQTPRAWLAALPTLILGAGIGAAGGLVYSGVKFSRERLAARRRVRIKD